MAPSCTTGSNRQNVMRPENVMLLSPLVPHTCGTTITSHYTTLHCIALHCITLYHITLHCIALHYIALHYITDVERPGPAGEGGLRDQGHAGACNVM